MLSTPGSCGDPGPDAAAILAMLLADSRFPAGTYAHSLGLEQAVLDGLTVEGVPAFAAARMRLVADPEARLSLAARRAAAAADLDGLAALDREHAARCPSPVLRERARRLGAQLLRTADTVWPDGVSARYRRASSTTPRPIALGVVAAAAALDDERLAALALYEDVATVTAAAVKLLPLDAARAARWVAELAGEIAERAHAVAADRRPPAYRPAPAAVALELGAHAHEQRRERLFAS